MRFDHVVEGDMLVIGSGIAGGLAAIRGLDAGKTVIVATKGKLCWSGASAVVGGAATAIPFPEDDPTVWMKAIVEVSDYTADQNWVRDYIENGYVQMEKISEITRKHGLEGFPLDNFGHYWRFSNPKYPVQTQLCNPYEILEAFEKELRQRGALCCERVMITHLLTSEGQVRGAFGFSYRTGESWLFCAPVVVMAAGGCTFKVDTYDNCGEPFAMAYDAGARMMSFDRGGALVRPRNAMRAGILDNVPLAGLPQWLGARFVNAEGTELSELMTPEELNSGRLGVDSAITREAAEGRGPIYEDCTCLSTKNKELLFRLKKANCKRVRVEYGLDPMQVRIPMRMEQTEQTYVPDVCNRMGGIDIDIHGESNIRGLFVAGDASAPKACAQHPFPGVEIGWAMFSGGRIGGHAAQACDRCKRPDVQLCRKLAEPAVFELIQALNSHGPVTPDALKEKVIETLIPYNRNHCDEEAMNACIARLEKVAEELLPAIGVRDFHELREYVEAKSMLWVALMIVKSEIRRKESRVGVHRRDYPMMDNVNWLKWIGFVKRDGRPQFFTEDIATPCFDVPKTVERQTRPRV